MNKGHRGLNIGAEERTVARSITVLKLSGNVVTGDGSIALRNRIREELEQGKTDFVIDFSEVRVIDSAGISEVLTAIYHVEKVGTIVLANTDKVEGVSGDNLKSILQAVRNTTPRAQSIDEALTYFGPPVFAGIPDFFPGESLIGARD